MLAGLSSRFRDFQFGSLRLAALAGLNKFVYFRRAAIQLAASEMEPLLTDLTANRFGWRHLTVNRSGWRQ